jgi:exosortase A-associated hydrolase 2
MPAVASTSLPLFLSNGVFAVWRVPAATRRVWLVCPPFAEEEKSARRTLAELCEVLNARGDATLTISFRGTGDSAGEFSQVSLDDWRDDIRVACAEIRRAFGNEIEVGLLGVRLGAALVAQMADEVAARHLVLIEPILNGRQYINQMGQRKRLRAMMTQAEGGETSAPEVPQSTLPNGVEDLDGWPLGETLRAGLQTLDLNQLAPFDVNLRVKVLQVGPREQIAVPLQKWCEVRNLSPQAVVMQPFWNLLDYAGATPLFEALPETASGAMLSFSAPVVDSHGEQAKLWRNASGQQLVGVWHPAQSTLMARATIVMLHGWSGYRSGPHQMLTRAARELAGCGYNIVRFDFAGRGDSEGDAEIATLATMNDDTRTVVQWCRAQSQAPIVVLGMCSGCEVAVAAASEKPDALVLWSAPVFAAQSSSSRDQKKRWHHLKKYAQKLLRPQTYVKILTGRVDTKSVKNVVTSTGGEAKNVESGAVGQLPKGFRAAALSAFEKLDAPILLVYGTADPTTEEALAWYRGQVKQTPHVQLIEGANHSYYGVGWEREVIDTTRAWLQKYFGAT